VVITDISRSAYQVAINDAHYLVIILGGQCNMVDFTWPR